MNDNFERIWEGKRKMRQRLAAAPIAEKLQMLDELRERALALRSAGFRLPHAVHEEPSSSYGATERLKKDS
jgi:hypothetical protein